MPISISQFPQLLPLLEDNIYEVGEPARTILFASPLLTQVQILDFDKFLRKSTLEEMLPTDTFLGLLQLIVPWIFWYPLIDASWGIESSGASAWIEGAELFVHVEFKLQIVCDCAHYDW